MCRVSPSALPSPRWRRLCARSGSHPQPALRATWATDRAGLERYAEDAPPVTDDQPRIEYATWVRPKEFGRVLPRLLALRTMPPRSGACGA